MEQKHRRPGRPRFDEKAQPTNEIILNAAAGLFVEGGYQKVSIDDVAKKSEVTKATVYYYYDTKANLFTEAMIQMMERIRRRIVSILSEKLPLRCRLLKVTEAHLNATFDIDLESFMREADRSLSPAQTRRIRKAEDQMYRELEKTFTAAERENEIRTVNPRFAAHAYMSLLRIGNYRQADNTPLFPTIRDATENIVQFFWNGLFPTDVEPKTDEMSGGGPHQQ